MAEGFKIRPKFPVIEPEVVDQREFTQEPMTEEQAREMFLKDMEAHGLTVEDKCKKCPDLVPCVIMNLLMGG